MARIYGETVYAALKAATRRLVSKAGGIESAASVTRVGKSQVHEYQSPDLAPFMPIDVVADIEKDVGDPLITRELAAIAGFKLVHVDHPSALHAELGRAPGDEKHICPMPLDLTHRATVLWSNRGDTVLSPFMGIGSEGVVALRLGRRFVGVELKESYFKTATRQLGAAGAQTDLFSQAAS